MFKKMPGHEISGFRRDKSKTITSRVQSMDISHTVAAAPSMSRERELSHTSCGGEDVSYELYYLQMGVGAERLERDHGGAQYV
jgi:hypothetical protein